MLSLISDYDFNEIIPHHSYVQDPFIKQDTQFSCGFRYLDNNYLLTLTFTTIENVTGTHGYSAVRITPTMIDNSGATFSDNRSSEKSTAIITYVPFNNTVVFFNELPNPVTIEVRSNSNNFQAAVSNETLYIPANKITDITLYPNWNTLADDLYHYQVKEYPSINGDIAVVKKYNTECMDNQTAKSIYSQRNFEVSFPSYLPEGFTHVCNSQNTDTYLIQVYANETAAENYKRLGLLHRQSNSNPYAYYLYPTMPQEELSGILLIHAQKAYVSDPQAELFKFYKQALNDTSRYYSTNPRFFSTNGNSYFSYYEGNILPVVDVAKADSTYRVEGLLPMSELEKVAESLSSQ
jgi:hypothetical protein